MECGRILSYLLYGSVASLPLPSSNIWYVDLRTNSDFRSRSFDLLPPTQNRRRDGHSTGPMHERQQITDDGSSVHRED